MQILVTSSGRTLDAPTSPVFGRCPVYILVDPQSMAFEAIDNPALGAPGGAGVQAAQFVVQRGVQAVITGNVGPNAYQVFQSAGIPVYIFGQGTVRQAVEAYKEGRLQTTGAATSPDHAGLRQQAAPAASQQDEVAALKEMAAELRGKLAEVIERIDRLERGE